MKSPKPINSSSQRQEAKEKLENIWEDLFTPWSTSQKQNEFKQVKAKVAFINDE